MDVVPEPGSAQQPTEREPYASPSDAGHWPEHAQEYQRWCFEKFLDAELALKEDTASIQKRAMIFVGAHWALVGATIQPLMGCPEAWVRYLIAGLLVVSGGLLLLVLAPRKTENLNPENLWGKDVATIPVVGHLATALCEQRRIVILRNGETRRRGTLTQWCCAAAAIGALTTLVVVSCTHAEREDSPSEQRKALDPGPAKDPAGAAFPAPDGTGTVDAGQGKR